ncbi:hypothetical protein BN6_36250 [Saccharothrix espanaensis DSM 44229]|uniref:Uncharacterized protein n=1 Tax=Saccharothrix espanaensis (strain ATCC 51144 / DSM 44229 / JCM 9112 / NBRC 15066 / NRRL 15764) TaxID=1179773 RepID=K0JT27_SACES|nr:hypothetical protein BN6_36250 [Saccharothrix espanaensis DSM 44229]
MDGDEVKAHALGRHPHPVVGARREAPADPVRPSRRARSRRAGPARTRRERLRHRHGNRLLAVRAMINGRTYRWYSSAAS